MGYRENLGIPIVLKVKDIRKAEPLGKTGQRIGNNLLFSYWDINLKLKLNSCIKEQNQKRDGMPDMLKDLKDKWG